MKTRLYVAKTYLALCNQASLAFSSLYRLTGAISVAESRQFLQANLAERALTSSASNIVTFRCKQHPLLGRIFGCLVCRIVRHASQQDQRRSDMSRRSSKESCLSWIQCMSHLHSCSTASALRVVWHVSSRLDSQLWHAMRLGIRYITPHCDSADHRFDHVKPGKSDGQGPNFLTVMSSSTFINKRCR